MKIIIFILTLLNLSYCEDIEEFFTFAEKSRSMRDICEKCSGIEESNPAKIQPKLLSSLTGLVVENNPSKAIDKTREAITLYDQNYSSAENYQDNKKLLNQLLKIYENAYSETSKELKGNMSEDDFEKWKKGDLEELKIEADKVITEGQHQEIFRDSIFKNIITQFEGL